MTNVTMNTSATAPIQNTNSFECLRLHQVCALTGLSKPSIYRMVKIGSFPKPFKIGERASAWLKSEVIGYMQQRHAANL